MPDNSASPILPSRSPGGVVSTTTDPYKTEDVKVITQANQPKPKGAGILSILNGVLSFKANPVQDTVTPAASKDNSGLYIVGAILLIFGFIYFFGKGGKK